MEESRGKTLFEKHQEDERPHSKGNMDTLTKTRAIQREAIDTMMKRMIDMEKETMIGTMRVTREVRAGVVKTEVREKRQ